jgi:hypothetical protein
VETAIDRSLQQDSVNELVKRIASSDGCEWRRKRSGYKANLRAGPRGRATA